MVDEQNGITDVLSSIPSFIRVEWIVIYILCIDKLLGDVMILACFVLLIIVFYHWPRV